MTPSGAAPDRDGDASVRRLTRRDALALSASLGAAVLLSACYGFSGGGGLPKNLKTVAIEPFDNETASPELQKELFDALRKTLHDRLNLREAPLAKADLVVTGSILKYDVDIPAGVSADSRQTTSTRRRLQLVIDIEIIEQKTSRSLLKKAGLSREGQYAEGGEVTGRRNAIESLMADIVDGVQSQW
ncbi:MAG: hypothetical protein K2R93_21345 [Gemmatimonadaceae bacterium]|nr:hypothetical protein [Gemmatimonadaceae bacterium]